MISFDFRRLITISDKIDVGSVKNTQEMKHFVGALHRFQSIKSAQ